jgi:hypothetical protein
MSWFLEDNDVKVAEELYAPKGASNTGEKVVTIKYVYILDSNSSNAKALVIEYEHENKFRGQERYWFIDKTTGKPKKPDGTPTLGSLQVANFFGALKIDPNSIKPQKTTIKVFGKEQEMPVFRELFDKKVRVVIQSKEEEHYATGEITEVDEVIGWYDVATRKNRKELADEKSVAKDIENAIKRSEKVRKLKSKKVATNSKDASGWGVEDNDYDDVF